MKADTDALAVIGRHLEHRLYAALDRRLSLEAPPGMTGFPSHGALSAVVDRLDPVSAATFRLLRLGEVIDDATFRAAFPEPVATALTTVGLVEATGGGWRTPGLLVVPFEGLLLLVGTPSGYPTAPGFPVVWFDLSTSFVAATLPARLDGERVLDVCSGTGVLAMLCARRGAEAVVGVELGAEAVEIARATAALNGLEERVDLRCSDMLDALCPDERFDFVVANLPYAPTTRGTDAPASAGELGNAVLWPLLDTLPAHLSERAHGVVATWRSPADGDPSSTPQLRAIATALGARGFAVSAHLDPAFDDVEGVLGLVAKDLDRRDPPAGERDAVLDRIRELLDAPGAGGFLNQLVHFRPGPDDDGAGAPPVSGLRRPDTPGGS